MIRFQRVLTGRHVGNIGRFRDVDFVDAVLHRSLRVFTLFNDQELVIIDGGDIAEFHCGVLFIRAGRDRVRVCFDVARFRIEENETGKVGDVFRFAADVERALHHHH